MAETPLYFPITEAQRLEPYLPQAPASTSSSSFPFVTLTFATSLDSALALGPGIRTTLSGPQSKAMTHYLRSRHEAILVGVGTAIADDPGLNCRLAPHEEELKVRQPRPIVIDPHLRWDFTVDSKVIRLAREGKGLAPYILTLEREPPAHKVRILDDVGGKFITLDAGDQGRRFDWHDVLWAVRREGLLSIMVEGGGEVINSLLSKNSGYVQSVIVTIAPVWLGRGGVTVCPPRTERQDTHVARLSDTTWVPLGEDVVLCGRIKRE